MSSVKRRINSTGRKKITREHIDIRMLPVNGDAALSASVNLTLAGLGFPSDASVVLEAYQRSSGMRFELGTIGALSPPSILHLNEIDRDGNVLFRLKVVDGKSGSGRILGSAERLRPGTSEETEGRRSIFPVIERMLGVEPWKVAVDAAGPSLVLNCRIPEFKRRILEDPLSTAIMLPTAFRIVLQALAADPVPDESDEEDWRALWLRYLKEKLSIDDDLTEMGDDDRIEWVETAVQKFCEVHGFVDAVRAEDRNLR